MRSTQSSQPNIIISNIEIKGSDIAINSGLKQGYEQSIGVTYPLATPAAVGRAVTMNGSFVHETDSTQKDALVSDMASWAIRTYGIEKVMAVSCPTGEFDSEALKETFREINQPSIRANNKLVIVEDVENLIGSGETAPTQTQSYVVACLQNFLQQKGNDRIPFALLTSRELIDFSEDSRAELVEGLQPVEFTAATNPDLLVSHKRDQSSPLSRKTRASLGLPT